MKAKHILHHKEIDGFRIKYDLCFPEKAGIELSEESDTLMNQDEYELFQKKTKDFLDNYSETVEEIEKLTCNANGVDYALAVTSGLIAGLLDAIFVGEWNFKEAKAISNEKMNDRVMIFAKKHPDYLLFCNNSLEGKGGTRLKPLDSERLETAIRFLEWKYPLPGDNSWKGVADKVTPKSHHLDDFSHHPTLGL